jgi:hypothetical protein
LPKTTLMVVSIGIYAVPALACEICAEVLEMNRPALACLETRAPELAEQARRSDPAFVSLVGCDGVVVTLKEGLRWRLGPEPPEGSSSTSGEESTTTPTTTAFFLSAAQLACLEGRFADLQASASDPVTVDLTDC